jgi:cell division protein FtsW
MVLIAWIDYRKLRAAQWAYFGISLVGFLLIVVFFVDPGHRWIKLPLPLFPFRLQPSELAKPALILFLAWFISMRREHINRYHALGPALLVMATLGAGVVVADLGSAVVLLVAASAILLMAGLSMRHCLAAMLVGTLCIGAAIAAKPYRLYRVLVFYDPEYKVLQYVDPERKMLKYAHDGSPIKDPAFHGEQSMIAVGAQGVRGVGIGNSRQKLMFLPEAHTDFIYAIIAEETGLFGALAVLSGFCVICWRGVRLFWLAPDDFGKFLAIGTTTAIVFQAFLNMSVVLALVPTKGIPLPLVSYGGTSLLSTLLLVGMLLSVSQRASRTA